MAFTKTNPRPQMLVKNTVPTPAEQKLKLIERAAYLEKMKANSAPGSLAYRNFEQDLEDLRALYKTILPDSEIIARVEKLAAIKDSLRITDNRAAYSRQTTRAVTALCGGAA